MNTTAFEALKKPFRAEKGSPYWSREWETHKERERIIVLLFEMAEAIDEAAFTLQGAKLRAGTGNGPDDADESLARLVKGFNDLFPQMRAALLKSIEYDKAFGKCSCQGGVECPNCEQHEAKVNSLR